ncbi:slipin family protein [Anaerosinus massiliensis]|uniref:slipin family protein n=1 Tax=Massilibacillus massiliensis TaxID=1806837 RepID=UPI000AD7F0DB|nr:slipin family protein [Massilibacillus massiliensis]
MESFSNKQNIKISTKKSNTPKTFLPFVIFLAVFAGFFRYAYVQDECLWIVAGFILAVIASQSLKVAQQWEKAVVLRLGKFHRLAGPGLFFTIPLIDTVPYWIDQRIHASAFNAEQTLTKDNVPVDVDAILFWVVWDAEKAALEVADYLEAVSWAAQTALRDVIGKTMLSDMLAGRENIDIHLQNMIDQRTEAWGIAVQSVEIRDVIIPEALQDAMSREAQAERERRARIILASAECEIAENFVNAAKIYEENDIAVKLKSMSLLYESVKERGGIVLVPNDMSDYTSLATTMGIQKIKDKASKVAKSE